MEWVVVILMLLNMCLLATVCLLMAAFLSHLSPKTEDTTQPPLKETTEDELIEDETVPLEQFKPDLSKPIKFVVKEDGESTTLEEEDEK